jgi:Protein of unknown function (DUF2911)
MKCLHRAAALSLLSALASASCASQHTQTWGFVATLGNDTTSVERVTRSGNHVVGEQVGRSPVVVHRHWEATVGPDGSLSRWTMDTHVPNAPAGQTDLHHELIFTGNKVRMIRETGRDTVDHTYVRSYARAVPWNAFLYASYEVLFQAARGLPDSTRIGQYFFEGWDEGHFGYATVQHLTGGDDSISSTGLAGSGFAHLDAQGRMLGYSGDGTTYKQEVKRVGDVPDIGALVERFAADERAKGFSRSLSARDTVRATLGAATITVDYSRPRMRGRTLVGGLIPYGNVWRTGANAATQLTVSAPVRLAGVALTAGTYTLWTLPTRDGVTLIINGQTGQWGTDYELNRDIARRPMQVAATARSVEQFTISIDAATPSLVMEWGPFRWSAPIQPAR